MAFAVPGLTAAEILTAVATPLSYSTAVSAEKVRMEQAVTASAQAACLHDGRIWWFLKAEATFDTTDTVGAYDLRTINSNALQDIWKPTRVMLDDEYVLSKGTKEQYEEYTTLFDTGTGKPTSYALAGDLYMYLWPKPDDAYTITVEHLKRHTKFDLTTASTNLLVPAEFHWGVYVDGPLWLLKHDTVDPASLLQSPQFQATMQRMATSDPSRVPFRDGDTEERMFDATRRVFQTEGGITI